MTVPEEKRRCAKCGHPLADPLVHAIAVANTIRELSGHQLGAVQTLIDFATNRQRFTGVQNAG